MIIGLLGDPDGLLQGELRLLTDDRLDVNISLTITDTHKQRRQEVICAVIHPRAGCWVGSCSYGLIPSEALPCPAARSINVEAENLPLLRWASIERGSKNQLFLSELLSSILAVYG